MLQREQSTYIVCQSKTQHFYECFQYFRRQFIQSVQSIVDIRSYPLEQNYAWIFCCFIAAINHLYIKRVEILERYFQHLTEHTTVCEI